MSPARCTRPSLPAAALITVATLITVAALAAPAAGAAPADRWLRLLAEYSRGAGGGNGAPDEEGGWFPRPIPIALPLEYSRGAEGAPDEKDGWFPRPIPIALPLGRGDGKQQPMLPVLILPVPVPADSQCSANSGPAPGNYPYTAPSAPAPYSPTAAAAPRAPPSGPARDLPLQRRPVFRAEEPVVPELDYIVSSQQLVELYRAQVAANPELPPAVIPDYTAGEDGTFTGAVEGEAPERRARFVRIRRYQVAAGYEPAPAPVPELHQRDADAAPPVPRLERSLMLRGELTVPRAGYTEPYTVWWDAAGGGARVDLHGGATSTYRTVLADGRVQGLEVRVDRSGEGEVRRCAVSAPRAPDASDRYLPAVPDLSDFSFAGYAEAGSVERWTRTVVGGAGELGAAPGEELTFRHEMLVARAPDNYTTTPLRYSVAVDSSVLGGDCDGYSHRYTELLDQHHDPALLQVDAAEVCEAVEQGASRERVDPLREYTLPHRDPRYDDTYRRFKSQHRRRYRDGTEEAVRKALLVTHERFVDSGNRQGATFSLEVNHLGDRLDEELRLLSGVREEAEGLPAEPFPHSRDQLAAMRGRLPRAFDWRERGAVTHVRNQGSCSSCWAFAVTGAVEGALYVRTRRLVPLSEQCLVDCAHPFGGHGCGGTWPSAAYDYVQERGLPPLADYTPYQAKVLTCLDRRVPPATRISSHVNVTRHSVQALKVAIRRHAPTVVIIDSTPKSFVFYKSGVLFDDRCAKNKAEHAVLAVGWGERRREAHFILKNSWSEAWGEAGYVRLAAAPNTCGVLSRPSYPRLERTDVDSLPDGGDRIE